MIAEIAYWSKFVDPDLRTFTKKVIFLVMVLWALMGVHYFNNTNNKTNIKCLRWRRLQSLSAVSGLRQTARCAHMPCWRGRSLLQLFMNPAPDGDQQMPSHRWCGWESNEGQLGKPRFVVGWDLLIRCLTCSLCSIQVTRARLVLPLGYGPGQHRPQPGRFKVIQVTWSWLQW